MRSVLAPPQVPAEELTRRRARRAAMLWCVLMAAGFAGLRYLLDARPEFVGAPPRYPTSVLVQEAPRVLLRGVSDDVSAVDEVHPDTADVRFELAARTDSRGLRVLQELAGTFEARFTLINSRPDPVFVLLRMPHPYADGTSAVGMATKAVRLEADGPGVRESSASAWYWSGRLDPGAHRALVVGYETAGVGGVRYALDTARDAAIRALRVAVRVTGVDRLVWDSKGGGGHPSPEDGPEARSVIWERKDFLPPDEFHVDVPEGRSLHQALGKLVEMGPLVSALYLVTILSSIAARRALSATIVQTVAIAFFFYFPLVLYLSVRMRFGIAVTLAAGIPGLLLANYLRWVLGPRRGLVGTALAVAIFEIFPTLAAFGAWNRGLVLLICGLVTLAVVIDLQNRAFRASLAAAAAPAASAAAPLVIAFALAILASPARAAAPSEASPVTVTLPAKLIPSDTARVGPAEPMVASLGVARYEARFEERFVEVRATIAVEVVREGPPDRVLVPAGVPIVSRTLSAGLYLAPVAAGLGLGARGTPRGTLEVVYRAPLAHAGERVEVELPLLVDQAGTFEVSGPPVRLDVTHGLVWSARVDTEGHWAIGVTGHDPLTLGYDTRAGADAAERAAAPGDVAIYGIRVLNADQLTVLHSDGSCAHFAAFELAADHPDVFEVMLPGGSQVLSTIVDGREATRAARDGERYRIPLEPLARRGESRLVAIRLALPPQPLGFLGSFELDLPQLDSTVGAIRWTIALPTSFHARVVSSGMEELGDAPPLDAFGDYGRALAGRRMIALGKTLMPVSRVHATVRYFQRVNGVSDDLDGSLPRANAGPAGAAPFQAPFFTSAARGRSS
ncbi:MAG: hypothetical protein U0610_18355 [bacterium]